MFVEGDVRVELDISALREDDDAKIEWLDRGFESTTVWKSKSQTRTASRTKRSNTLATRPGLKSAPSMDSMQTDPRKSMDEPQPEPETEAPPMKPTKTDASEIHRTHSPEDEEQDGESMVKQTSMLRNRQASFRSRLRNESRSVERRSQRPRAGSRVGAGRPSRSGRLRQSQTLHRNTGEDDEDGGLMSPQASEVSGGSGRTRRIKAGVSRKATLVLPGGGEAAPSSVAAGLIAATAPPSVAVKQPLAAFGSSDGQCTGAHKFNRFQAARPSACSGCHTKVVAGSTVYGCENCYCDLCSDCFEKRPEAQGEDQMKASTSEGVLADLHSWATNLFGGGSPSSQADAAVPPPPSPVAQEAAKPAGSTEQSARSQLLSSQTLQPHQLRVAAGPYSAAQLLSAHTEAMGPSPSKEKKECKFCHRPYTGFGSACGACRKFGPSGAVQQCSICSQFFTGFGNICEECIHGGETPD